jgi:hypothetical protein
MLIGFGLGYWTIVYLSTFKMFWYADRTDLIDLII